MTLAEYYDRQVPEYYPTMYMDGYTPDQILHAVHRKMVREYLEREAEKQAKKDAEECYNAMTTEEQTLVKLAEKYDLDYYARLAKVINK